MPAHKQKRIAQETMDIFAPFANRLGIWQMKWELEDLAFRYVDSEMYKEIARNISERRSEREKQVVSIVVRLMEVLSEAGLDPDISGRPKHIYSIYKKMQRKGVPFDMVHDIRGVRILVPEKCGLLSSFGCDPLTVGVQFQGNLMIILLLQKIIFTSHCIRQWFMMTEKPLKCKYEQQKCMSELNMESPLTGVIKKVTSTILISSVVWFICDNLWSGARM